MSNHLHILLEVPEGCKKGEPLGLTNDEILRRLGGFYSRGDCASVTAEIAEAEELIAGRIQEVEGAARLEEYPPAEQNKMIAAAKVRGEQLMPEIHARYSYRMHSLSEFFKGLLHRFTCWYNRENGRKGMDREKAGEELARLSEERARDLKISKVIQCRVRYFTDGAVIGSKSFVDGVYQASRERCGPKRKDGARKP